MKSKVFKWKQSVIFLISFFRAIIFSYRPFNVRSLNLALWPFQTKLRYLNNKKKQTIDKNDLITSNNIDNNNVILLIINNNIFCQKSTNKFYGVKRINKKFRNVYNNFTMRKKKRTHRKKLNIYAIFIEKKTATYNLISQDLILKQK